MTYEQRRIACAEMLGWKLSTEIDRFGNRFYEKDGVFLRADKWPSTHKPLPDPEASLNDCKPLIDLIIKSDQSLKLACYGTGFHVEIWGDKYISCVKDTPESAIVEAFLKWKGKT